MSNFILKVSLFILSLILLYAAAAYIVTPEKSELQNDFMAAMIDKHARAENIGSPKIVIAGGSNIAFNIDSEKVQQELQLPVVNIGLNVGLGIKFILEELKDVTGSNDVVFLFMTYFEDPDGVYALKKHTIEHFEDARAYHQIELNEEFSIHTSDTRNHVRNKIVSLILRKKRVNGQQITENESIYSRDNFNEFGDFEGHHGLEPASDLDQRFEFQYQYWQGIELLNNFSEYAQQNNLHVYYVFPAYPETEFEKNRDVIKRFEEDLRNNLTMQILGNPETYLFEEEMFYDTVYHLTKEGKERRTDIFLEQLTENPDVWRSILSARNARLSSGTILPEH